MHFYTLLIMTYLHCIMLHLKCHCCSLAILYLWEVQNRSWPDNHCCFEMQNANFDDFSNLEFFWAHFQKVHTNFLLEKELKKLTTKVGKNPTWHSKCQGASLRNFANQFRQIFLGGLCRRNDKKTMVFLIVFLNCLGSLKSSQVLSLTLSKVAANLCKHF